VGDIGNLTSTRRAVAVIAVLVVFLCQAALAFGNGFGIDRVNKSQLVSLHGTRSDIQTPGNVITVPTGNALVERVAAEQAQIGGSGPGIIQAGFGRTNNPPGTFDCGSSNGTHDFVELVDSSNNKTCFWELSAVTTNRTYEVVRENNCPTCWQAIIDGQFYISSNDAGWDFAGHIAAGAEILVESLDEGSSIRATFGKGWPSSGISWQRTADACCNASWTTIMQATDAVNTDGDSDSDTCGHGDWCVDAPPSPMLIKYGGP
jgi:hypothetical protein